jgi:hypothetical protein
VPAALQRPGGARTAIRRKNSALGNHERSVHGFTAFDYNR